MTEVTVGYTLELEVERSPVKHQSHIGVFLALRQGTNAPINNHFDTVLLDPLILTSHNFSIHPGFPHLQQRQDANLSHGFRPNFLRFQTCETMGAVHRTRVRRRVVTNPHSQSLRDEKRIDRALQAL